MCVSQCVYLCIFVCVYVVLNVSKIVNQWTLANRTGQPLLFGF